jgi:dihydroorotate dehydrogenase (NAD+) catalytic subunit
MVDLRVALGPISLQNPVLVAAGTFGYGIEFERALDLSALGGIITKTLTQTPREGNPPPRLVETPSGMLNAVGLQNVGLEPFLREKLPSLRKHQVPVIVSLLSDTPEELAGMAAQASQAEGVAALEINLSCPNVHRSAGSGAPSIVAQDPAATSEMVRAACSASRKPVIAKLSPDVTDLAPVAQAAEKAGACALTIGNTFVGMSLDPATRKSRLGAMTGGLSGPAIRPLAVYRVWYTARSVSVPVIGLGGIARAEDAVEFLLAGATAVAVGTASFADPKAAIRIIRGLARYLERQRVQSVAEIRGAVNS